MNTSSDGSKRVRVRKACLPCSSRKRKCDGALPCNTCTGYGYQCRYRNESNPPRFDANRNVSPNPLLCPDRHAAESLPLPQMATPASGSELPEQVNEVNHGLVVVSSSKYLGRHSSQAFPRFLGLQMRAQVLPRLQPFAWNMNIRPRAPLRTSAALCSLITLANAQLQLSSFFRSKFPACCFLDHDTLAARCDMHWGGENQGLPFEALICGVLGLASVINGTISIQQESIIMGHAEKILQDQAVLAEANVEFLAALLLRTLYLRATATPQLTWMSNCTAMHMAESLGLHKQYTLHGGREQTVNNQWNDKARSYLFWIICSGNRLGSYELGRSPVLINDTTQEFPFQPSDSSSAATFCRLCCLLPPKVADQVSEGDQNRFLDSLEEISNMQCDQPFLSLIAADVCFIMYRRIQVSSHQRLSKQQLKQVISIGAEAVNAAEKLLSKGQLWWSMPSTMFQFCCVLISIDSIDSLAHLQSAMRTIDRIREQCPGENIAEASNTLKALIAASRQKKDEETAYLAIAEDSDSLLNNPQSGAFDQPNFALSPLSFNTLNWAIEDLDWISAGAPLGQ